MDERAISREVRRLKDRNMIETRPIAAADVVKYAVAAAKRDNPGAPPCEITQSVMRRITTGARPHQPAAPAERSPTAADLRRADRKAMVRNNRHMRRS